MAEQVRVHGGEADGALAVGLQMAEYLTQLPPQLPTALDNYNVESLILSRLAATRHGLKRAYWNHEAAKLRRIERRVLERAKAVFAISETDRAAMAALAPKARLFSLPMAIDLDYFAAPTEAVAPARPRFAFVGAFNWHVNEDAAVWLCERVWPAVRRELADAELLLVGREPSAVVRALGQLDGVSVTGTVPDVRPYIQESTALLVPLRYGSGVRTKILEAFAGGRPVVSSSVGCEGLSVCNGENILIGDTSDDFAAACVELALRPLLAKKIALAGQRFAEEQERYSITEFHRQMEQVFGILPGMPLGTAESAKHANSLHH
jgi:glycosyltransferase involved in cell wall biosynthesis